MTKEQARDEAKYRLEEYLSMITEKKGSQYICPVCGSGKGANKTPAGHIYKDRQVFHCFSCNFHGDIFELAARVEGISNVAEKFKRVYEILNIQVEQKLNVEPVKDYTEYFKKCAARVSDSSYFARRGLSQRVIEKFGLGYDPEWQSPTAQAKGSKTYPSKRVIIPTSPNSYLARATEPNVEPRFKVIKEGRSELFNKQVLQGDELVFIVEGEFDALSVIEAGGQAVALGSTGNKNKFIELCKKAFPIAPIILCLDNDDAGRRTQSEIADALKALNIAFLEQNISGEYKDPNEYLTSDSDAFKAIISADYLQVFKEEAEAASEKHISEKYINETSVTSKIEDFLGVIKASVDTPAIPTGFKELDKILDDGLYEGLYILRAGISVGKTSFALQIADQIARQEQDALIFSLEMARAELMAKSISRISFAECGDNIKLAKTVRGITSGKRHLDYGRDEKAHINDSINQYAGYTNHLFIYEGEGNIGVEQVRELTETHVKVTGRTPIVIIDYMQILAPYELRATDKYNIDKAVFELKRLSRDLKIPVIGISSAEYQENGAIAYSSDVLMRLQSESADGYPCKIELTIVKNRNGTAGGSVTFDYFPMYNCFFEVKNTPAKPV